MTSEHLHTAIEVKALDRYFGPIHAVRNISFSVNRGEVLGFLGPNGAGKSTTMKMITGFLEPSQGAVLVNGLNVVEAPLKAKSSIGYLPEGAPSYGEMTVLKFLEFIAEIRGYHGSEKRERVNRAIQQINLESVVDQTIDTLSKGFRRRVGLAQAILHDPDILIMVTACSIVALLVLFPIAWLLGRQTPRVGLPTLEAAPA